MTLGATAALLAGLWVVRPRGSPPLPTRVDALSDMEWHSCFADPTMARSVDHPAEALSLLQNEASRVRHMETLHHNAASHLKTDPRWWLDEQPVYLGYAITANYDLLEQDREHLENIQTTMGCLEAHLGDEVAANQP